MPTSPSRRAALLLAALAGTLGAALVAVPGSASAVTVSPDVPSLPVGPPPSLPYLDVPAKQIVDGNRHVDVAGLKGTVVQLFKVDGGYLLGRRSYGVHPDLVFIDPSGKRTLVTTRWYAPQCDCLISNFVAVDSTGGSVTFSRENASFDHYRDTVNVALPSLKIVRKRAFSSRPALYDQHAGRTFLGLDTRLLAWTPKTAAIRTISSGRSVEAADISAGQQVRRAEDGDQTVGPLPPRSAPHWPLDPDGNVSAWSLDNTLIAGTGENIHETTQDGIWARRAADGHAALVVRENAQVRLVWENATTLLIASFHEGSEEQGWESRHQLIRCTLAGECQRVGPETAGVYGGYLVATRRSN